MHFLYETEIKQLACQAEKFVTRQRAMMSLLKSNPIHHKLIIPETGIDIAKYLLADKHHLEGDIKRLSKQIDINLVNMEWYDNL